MKRLFLINLTILLLSVGAFSQTIVPKPVPGAMMSFPKDPDIGPLSVESTDVISPQRPGESESWMPLQLRTFQVELGTSYNVTQNKFQHGLMARYGISRIFEVRIYSDFTTPYFDIAGKALLLEAKGYRPGIAAVTYFNFKSGLSNATFAITQPLDPDNIETHINVAWNGDYLYVTNAYWIYIGKFGVFTEYAFHNLSVQEHRVNIGVSSSPFNNLEIDFTLSSNNYAGGNDFSLTAGLAYRIKARK